MRRVVVDTNIVVSATFWQGPPLTVIQEVEQGLITLLTSNELLEELRRTLSKQKFVRALIALGVTSNEIVELFQARAEMVIPV